MIAVLLLNPQNRVYSHHGLIHTSIIYRIANGEIPPSHPFFADHPLPYPWGFHFLAAQFVRLGLSPPWAVALINVAAFAACLVLAWGIARKLTDTGPELQGTHQGHANHKTWVTSMAAFCALFAPSFAAPALIERYIQRPLAWSLVDPRSMPVVKKFVNLNGMPLGIAAALLWLWGMIAALEGRRPVASALAVFLGLAFCAFFYPPVLPVLVVGTPAAAAAVWLRSPATQRRGILRIGFLVCGVGAAGVLVTAPYLLQVRTALRGSMKVLDPAAVKRNLSCLLIVALPTLAFLFAFRRCVRERLAPIPAQVLAAVFASSSVLYLGLSQPERTEYKYLGIGILALGFVGGAVFALTWRKTSPLSWILGTVLLVSPTYAMVTKLRFSANSRIDFAESGRDLLYTRNAETGELFTWIREESPVGTLFLDPTGMVPIYGQRGVLMSPNRRHHLGFGGNPYKFLFVGDERLLARRTRVLKGVAGPEQTRQVLSVDAPVYRIVDNRSYAGRPLEPKLWREVYRSSRGRYEVHAWLAGGGKSE